jgi:nitroreductase
MRMSNPVLSAISDRRSIRGYKAQDVTTEQLDALLAAALQSPSARNAQPWHFSVVRDKSIVREINAETIKTWDLAWMRTTFFTTLRSSYS